MSDAPPPGSTVDWRSVDNWFLRECGKTPAEVDGMTLSEIAVALEKSGPKPAYGGQMDNAALQAYAEHWRSMTLKERLIEGARELGAI